MTEEALDEKLSKYKVSQRLFDDQLEDLCEPPLFNGWISTITKTPLKFPNQTEQKNSYPVAFPPPPPPPPKHKWDKSVTHIILPILVSEVSANTQKEYVVYSRGTCSDWLYPTVCSTIDAH